MIHIDEKCMQHVVDILKGKKIITDDVKKEIILQLERKINGQLDYLKRKAIKMGKVRKPSEKEILDIDSTNQ